MIPPAQRPVAAWLTTLAGRAPIETHISAVFVGRDTAWKMKKAVRLSFLDFTDIAERGRLLRHELALNRRTAPEIYRDVAGVVCTGGAFALDPEAGPAEAREWVLRMAPVPAEDFLDARAEAGLIDEGLLRAIADTVAFFHLGLPPADLDPLASLLEVASGNARAAHAAGLPEARLRVLTERTRMALHARSRWLAARRRDGFIRRAHGDLHLGNICLWHGKPVLIDALEFDEKLATIDLGYDLAFLLMDLERKLGRAAANTVLNRYVARTGDAGLTAGLSPFISLRASVRAHVRKTAGAQDWERYLAMAEQALNPHPPLVVAVGGL